MCGPSRDDDWMFPPSSWPYLSAAVCFFLAAVCWIWWAVSTAPDMSLTK